MPVTINFTLTLFSVGFEKKHERVATSVRRASYFILGCTWRLRRCFVAKLMLQDQEPPTFLPNRQLCNSRLSNGKVIYSKQCLWPAILLRLMSLSVLAEILAAFHSCYESYSGVLMVSEPVAQNLGPSISCLVVSLGRMWMTANAVWIYLGWY